MTIKAQIFATLDEQPELAKYEEREQCREALAAAEAWMAELCQYLPPEWIRHEEDAFHSYQRCATCWERQEDGHDDDCIWARLDDSHAALDAALEQRTIRAIDAVNRRITSGEWPGGKVSMKVFEARERLRQALLAALESRAIDVLCVAADRIVGAPQMAERDWSKGEVDALEALMGEHYAALEAARDEERERCCAAMCRYCCLEVPVVKEGGKWLHRNETQGGVVTTPCWAGAIRNTEEDDDA